MPNRPACSRTPFRPSRWRWGGLAALLLAVLALACSGSSRRDPAGALQVINAGTRNMTSLLVTPSSSSVWGPDQLYPALLAPGSSLVLGPMPPMGYDVQATFADGVVDSVVDVQVLDETTTTLPMANVGMVSVVNGTNLWITGLYLVPSTATGWGADQLSGTILPGGRFNLDAVPPGTYDLQVVFVDSSVQEYRGFRLDPAQTYTVTVH